jgi:hypothetical protein
VSYGAIKLLVKAAVAAARLLDENSGKTASDERVNAAIKKTRSMLEAEKLLKQLNRSQVFTFEYDQKRGIVLTSCRKVHDVPNLTVPEGVNTIGDEAFGNCVFLKSIKISDTVETIGEHAFSGCTNLTDVQFSKGLKTIGCYAFNQCGITKAELPEGLQKLGHRAFYECGALKSVKIPNSITSLEAYLFYRCFALEEVILPFNLTGTLCGTFAHCTSLKEFCIPEGVREIEDWAFEYCEKLEKISIPGSVTKIYNRAFLDCTSLKYIHIPDSVKEIECSAVFDGCKSLEKIRLPIGVNFTDRFEKGFHVFDDCRSLRTVILGIQRFDVTKPPDLNDLTVMHIGLAADGQPTARRFVLENLTGVMKCLVEAENVFMTEKLLSSGLISTETADMQTFDEIIDLAANSGAHEIYVMLVQYKRDKLGFDIPEDRFEL